MKTPFLFGLPPLALNMLSGGVSILIVCLGVRVATAPELSLNAANAQLVVSDSASQLTELSSELNKQAEAIKVRDEAYDSLLATYEQSLKGKEGYGKLQAAIETIDSLPSPDNINAIQEDIQETELDLSEKLGE
jgi:hypothetical protein